MHPPLSRRVLFNADARRNPMGRFMFLEHSPARQGGFVKPVYSVAEFCAAHNISRSKLYQEWAAGTGPRVMRVGVRILISTEAAAEWRLAHETEYAAGVTA
jgi:hypothetical protein